MSRGNEGSKEKLHEILDRHLNEMFMERGYA